MPATTGLDRLVWVLTLGAISSFATYTDQQRRPSAYGKQAHVQLPWKVNPTMQPYRLCGKLGRDDVQC